MKKAFISPKMNIVETDMADIVCASGGLEGIEIGEDNDDDKAAKGRHSAIWDD